MELPMSLKTTVAEINKKYGEGTMGFASDVKYTSNLRLPSGSLFLDYILGRNSAENKSGWPIGTIIELYGPESSGKSLISMKTIVEAQKMGFDCAYMDCEKTFDPTYATKLGIDVNKLIVSREQRAEKVLDTACKLVQEESVKVIVFDSIASMVPIKALESDLDDPQQMAAMAFVMSRGLPKLIALNKNNTLCIFINQLREKPGVSYGNPEYTPGGKAIKYYSSLRVEVRRGDWLFDEEDKKKKIGQVVKFKAVKNKTDIPLRDGYFNFIYETGVIDKMDELISIGLLNETISRQGSYYTLLDVSLQGKEALAKKLLEDQEFFEKAKLEVFGK